MNAESASSADPLGGLAQLLRAMPQWPLQALDKAVGVLEEKFPPPPWFVHESQQRIVLLVNHVLQGEPEAMARLKRHAGKRIRGSWRSFGLQPRITPVGLLEVLEAGDTTAPDLVLVATQNELVDLAQHMAGGQSPKLRIEGDVQLAAEIGWLAQHVRWDMAEDLSRVVGEGPAHLMVSWAKGLAEALSRLVPQKPAAPAAADAPAANEGAV
jgi:ubiquinone biosynthesis accessory factor UbiJ